MLGYLLMYRWACEGRRAVLHTEGQGVAKLFTKDGVYCIASDYELESILAEDDVM